MTDFIDGTGLVDPAAFPVRSADLDIDWLEEQVTFCRQLAGSVGRAAGEAHRIWGGIRDHYDAPEAGQLYRTMDPVRSEGERERAILFEAAHRTDGFAQELGPLKRRLRDVEDRAEAFRSRVAGGVWTTPGDVVPGFVWPQDISIDAPERILDPDIKVSWDQHRPSLARNDALLADARRVTDQIQAATEEFESRLRGLENPLATPVSVGAGVLGIGAAGASAMAAPTAPDVSAYAPTAAILAGSAEDVRAWWDSLTPDQQRALVAAMPLVMGNLNGVPLKFRAQANEINLHNEIARLEAELERLDRQIGDARTTNTGESLGAKLARVDHLQDQRDAAAAALASYRGYLDLDDAPGEITERRRREYDENGLYRIRSSVELVSFNPATASIATYYGPYDENGDIPVWMKNVAVHSPGMGTRMDDFHRTDESLYRIYNRANDPVQGAEPTAVLAWAGGVYPSEIPDAMNDEFYLDLGPKFRDFVEGGVSAPEPARLTVTGHSYGGAIVATAEKSGLAPDAVVYVSAAGLGTGVDSVGEFESSRDAPHYAMLVRNDTVTGPIQKLPMHGASALYDYEYVTRLETGFKQSGDPESGALEGTGAFFQSHSAAYYDGSTAQKNIVGVITRGQVELFAPDRVAGMSHTGHPITVDGIQHAEYEANIVDLAEFEKQKADGRAKGNP